jgi:multidrug resistance efflux pump
MSGTRSIRRIRAILVAVLLAACAGGVAYLALGRAPAATPIVGVVRETEIRIAPEISGRLASFAAKPGQVVHKGDVLAVLDNPELAAALEEAKATAGEAKAARDRVYAGVRQERVNISAKEVQKAEAELVLAQQEYKRYAALAKDNFATKQKLDEVTAALQKAQANLGELRSRYARASTGATAEQRATADAGVAFADAATAVLAARLVKTRLVAPVDGTVGILVAEPGEAIVPGQPVMTLEAGHERWFSFTVREDRLGGINIGTPLRLTTGKGETVAARVTELRPLGEFATWRAARAVGDHDLNSFFVRADPVSGSAQLEPGMTVWLSSGS